MLKLTHIYCKYSLWVGTQRLMISPLQRPSSTHTGQYLSVLTMKIESSANHFLALSFLNTIIGLSQAQVATKYNTSDCRTTTYCPHWGVSCVKLYNSFGGPENDVAFVAEYPCCVCDPGGNESCVCARKGNITNRFIDLSESGLPLGVGLSEIARGNLNDPNTRKTVKREDCITRPDCEKGDYCRQLCISKGKNATYVNVNSKCCVCQPLEAGCDNCFCAQGNLLEVTTYTKLTNGKQVGDDEKLLFPRILEGSIDPSVTVWIDNYFYSNILGTYFLFWERDIRE